MLCVLLVDGDASFRRVLSDMLLLEFPSIFVEEAGDAAEALRKTEYLCPDIIFTEIRLPGESGLELFKATKRMFSATNVFILTTDDSLSYRQQALGSGVAGYISKGDGACLTEVLVSVKEALARRTPD